MMGPLICRICQEPTARLIGGYCSDCAPKTAPRPAPKPAPESWMARLIRVLYSLLP